MKREEIPNETPRKDMMREALKHYEELATKACWHRSDIPEAIRAYYAPLPPAEGAEEILLSHPYLKVMYDDTAGEVCMVEQAIWAIEKYATLHAQRIADKIKEANQFILDIAGVLGIETDDVGFDGLTLSIDDFKEAADKMVSERLREELIDYNKAEWFKTFEKELEGKSLETTIMSIDEYLKSREK